MKKIKIIDLFIEYTKPVKQPKKIRFKDKLYIYNGHAVLSQLIKDYGIDIVNLLNDEVEILEDEKKIPEKLPNKFHYTGEEEVFAKKINEILDYLESKGE